MSNFEEINPKEAQLAALGVASMFSNMSSDDDTDSELELEIDNIPDDEDEELIIDNLSAKPKKKASGTAKPRKSKTAEVRQISSNPLTFAKKTEPAIKELAHFRRFIQFLDSTWIPLSLVYNNEDNLIAIRIATALREKNGDFIFATNPKFKAVHSGSLGQVSTFDIPMYFFDAEYKQGINIIDPVARLMDAYPDTLIRVTTSGDISVTGYSAIDNMPAVYADGKIKTHKLVHLDKPIITDNSVANFITTGELASSYTAVAVYDDAKFQNVYEMDYYLDANGYLYKGITPNEDTITLAENTSFILSRDKFVINSMFASDAIRWFESDLGYAALYATNNFTSRDVFAKKPPQAITKKGVTFKPAPVAPMDGCTLLSGAVATQPPHVDKTFVAAVCAMNSANTIDRNSPSSHHTGIISAPVTILRAESVGANCLSVHDNVEFSVRSKHLILDNSATSLLKSTAFSYRLLCNTELKKLSKTATVYSPGKKQLNRSVKKSKSDATSEPKSLANCMTAYHVLGANNCIIDTDIDMMGSFILNIARLHVTDNAIELDIKSPELPSDAVVFLPVGAESVSLTRYAGGAVDTEGYDNKNYTFINNANGGKVCVKSPMLTYSDLDIPAQGIIPGIKPATARVQDNGNTVVWTNGDCDITFTGDTVAINPSETASGTLELTRAQGYINSPELLISNFAVVKINLFDLLSSRSFLIQKNLKYVIDCSVPVGGAARASSANSRQIDEHLYNTLKECAAAGTIQNSNTVTFENVDGVAAILTCIKDILGCVQPVAKTFSNEELKNLCQTVYCSIYPKDYTDFLGSDIGIVANHNKGIKSWFGLGILDEAFDDDNPIFLEALERGIPDIKRAATIAMHALNK